MNYNPKGHDEVLDCWYSYPKTMLKAPSNPVQTTKLENGHQHPVFVLIE